MAEILEEQEEQEVNKKERKGVLPILFKILKYLVLFLALTLFIIVISIITVRALQSQSRIQNAQNRVSLDIQQSVPEDLDWYSTLGEIRGNLLDEGRKTFIVDLYIGYTPGDQGSLQELVRRNVQIKERISLYFSSHYYNEVQGARNLIKMKNELREIINRMLNNKIREIAFNTFQVIEF